MPVFKDLLSRQGVHYSIAEVFWGIFKLGFLDEFLFQFNLNKKLI